MKKVLLVIGLVPALCLASLVTEASDGAAPGAPSRAPAVDSDWWGDVTRGIAASEYHVTWQDRTCLEDVAAAWHAPNRAHGLRTYFTERGIRVVPRGESEPSWDWGLELIGYGRGATVLPIGDASLAPYGNRIDYDRGPIVEWYRNDRHGLEQGFTLAGPPDELGPLGADGRTVPGARDEGSDAAEEKPAAFLALSLGGSLNPAVSTDGQAIDFAAPGGRNVLHYRELHVFDAGGRELPAWLEGFAEAGVSGVRIVFDDGEAVYPVTVDPVVMSQGWLAYSDQANANFGISVSTAGDVNGDGWADVVVGAANYDNGQVDEGRAYVYHGTASGASSAPAWTAESDQAGARFGASVSTAGDVNGDGHSDVIVGASYYEDVQLDEGRVFVYHGSPSGLSTVADWTAESDQYYAQFGHSVSTAGDVNGDGYSDVIVGADHHDGAFIDEGRVFVYHGSASGLSAVAAWTVTGGQVGAGLGSSVSTAGDVDGDGYADVIVGADLHDGTFVDEGRVLVYHGSASGLSAVATWGVTGGQVGAGLGSSVATAGDVNGDGYADVIVAAPLFDDGFTDEGKVEVYHGSASGLSATAAWGPTYGSQDSAELGHSVSTAGDVNGDGYADVFVGAPGYWVLDPDEGAVALWLGSPSGLQEDADWLEVCTSLGGARCGSSVGTAGDVNGDGYSDVIVGAPGYMAVAEDDGRAAIYHGSPNGLAEVEGWSAEGDQADANLGWSVATAGDVNGDGYADVVVGAAFYDGGHVDEGRAYLYHGSSSGPAPVESWSASGGQPDARFGWSVATAGDVNGDGYYDVVIGAPNHDGIQENQGRAYVYEGAATGLGPIESWSAAGDGAHVLLGWSVSTAGDVNGDGYADVIVGEGSYSNGESLEGRACVYHGSAAGLAAAPSWFVEGDQQNAFLGRSVSTAGDVNGDGYDDVVVGAEGYDDPTQDEGRAFIYRGSASGLGTAAAWTAAGEQVGASFGRCVATAGDVNGDGYSDVAVAAPYHDGPETDQGRAYVYHGSPSGMGTIPDWTVDGDQAGDLLGVSIATAGDVNGDGHSDVILGVVYHSNGESFEGRADLHLGSAAGLSAAPDWSVEGNQADAYLGSAVATAGDVNGDGYADVVVGATGYANGESQEGCARVYYGGGGSGIPLVPQQRRADDLAPIAGGGRSRVSGSFRLAAVGRTPFGRGRVRLEWEVEPFGRPFDGTGTGHSDWLDSGTGGAAFGELGTGLTPGPFHWRMRLLYDPATTPLLNHSRWFTVPRNGWEERDVTVSPFVGGRVWEDRDGDGVMQADEPRLAGVAVDLLDDAGAPIDGTITAADGSYVFEPTSLQVPVRIRFVVPDGWRPTVRDQGTDDLVDSDADTVTGETATLVPPFEPLDEQRWSAGLRRVGICFPCDEPVYIYTMTIDVNGNPVLHFQDPNQPGDVTGYNVYRSSDPGLPHDQWPLIADDVVDMDESAPNKQWVDTSGDDSPTGTWYYQVAAYNHECPTATAEGPW